jgi:hypothetical protein
MTPRSGLRCCGLTRIRGPLAGRRELEADTSASQTADAHLRDRWLGDPAVGGHAWRQRGDQLSRTRATLACVPVRAENRIHGSDQQSCSPGALPAMITGHVPAVPVPPDHSASRMAAAVPARGGVENRRDPDPAPPARGPAAAAAAPPEAELGGPGPARGTARRDTKARRQGLRLVVTPDTIVRWHRDIVRRRQAARSVRGRTGRPVPPEYQGPGPPAGPGEPRMGLPPDPRRAGRPGSQDSGAGRLGDPQGQRHRPRTAADRSRPGRSSCAPRPTRSWHPTSSPSTCPAAPGPASWP